MGMWLQSDIIRAASPENSQIIKALGDTPSEGKGRALAGVKRVRRPGRIMLSTALL